MGLGVGVGYPSAYDKAVREVYIERNNSLVDMEHS